MRFAVILGVTLVLGGLALWLFVFRPAGARAEAMTRFCETMQQEWIRVGAAVAELTPPQRTPERIQALVDEGRTRLRAAAPEDLARELGSARDPDALANVLARAIQQSDEAACKSLAKRMQFVPPGPQPGL